MQLDFIRFEGGSYQISDWELFKVKGLDSFKFLQGQLTNDLSSLQINESQLTCRLNRNGQVISFFFVSRKKEYFLIFIPKVFSEKTIRDLIKFVIMEDVEITPFAQNPTVILTPLSQELKNYFEEEEMFYLKFFGEDAILLWGENLKKKTPFIKINDEEFKTLQILSGYPTPEEILSQEKIVNELYLNEIAVSYKKGCFLGQETIAKVQNFRGPAYFPVLLKFEGPINFETEDFEIEGRKGGKFLDVCDYENITYIKTSLFRDFRLEGKELVINNKKAKVIYFPFFKNNNPRSKAIELYHRAVESFKRNEDGNSIDLLERAIVIDKTFPDSYESLGVILGRHGKYEQGIVLMDKLLLVDPNSIMAHTNKSLFLMKLGRISEAEEEKQKAIVKNFEKIGNESQFKKENEEKKIKEEQDLVRKENMFMQVLEIDHQDTIANFGLGEIYFKKGNLQKSQSFIEKTLNVDPKYSKAYLLLGKIFEANGDITKAKEIFQNGISIASKKGEMIPANEMQQRLSNLGDTVSV